MISALKGMKDRYFDDIKKYDFIVNISKQVFSKYGFEKIITPILEESELFRRGVGDETDVVSKEMYNFKDKGDRDVTMRPEGTAGVVRAYLESKLYKSNPIVKWFYYGPMYRYEAPQKGRFREFHQIGTEFFGVRSAYLDAEVIKMGCELLENLGIKDIVVEINSLGNIESRKKYIYDLKKFMFKIFDKLSEDSKKRYENNPLRALDSKDKGDQEEFKNAPKLYDYLDEESKQYFEDTKRYLSLLGVKYIENWKLVRGLDYYSDTVFEIKSNKLGSQSTILAGGRYDRLLEILGDVSIPGIGFAAGIDRIAMLMDDNLIKENEKKVFIVYFNEVKDYFIKVVSELRENGIKVEFDYNPKSFSTQLKKANKINSEYVLILGEEEENESKVTLKEFKTGNQEKYTIEEAILKLETK
ncbi:MAG: histidine--tRNA ligase [Leptotrichiaceae bacterium]|nr:histidine--tRNA ligase [Leptotrichiaceae bacterium]MBP6281023.1 histidine--tRNA ligase [Leptotrichiaceae bacterium]MBP7100380.1 histidine--tRNA ligase [Leptotrichiaceae bacterium]MBP7725017.1 histidine--tRNA ligase [Leptotrichiaceae bacterium]MBP9629620.1 histidine--tRNA ligase [Leptotrichiaceae bacterium]